MISQKRYANITSGVGGGAGVRTRQLILRIITTSNKLAPTEIREFSNPDDVLSFFGDATEEYKRAVRYFGFISKSITAPQLISYARWVKTATTATIKASQAPDALTAFQAMTEAQVQFVTDTTTILSKKADLSAATDMTNVATLMSAALTGLTDPVISGGRFTYDSTQQRFAWYGANGAGSYKIGAIGGTNDAGSAMKLSSEDAIVSPGISAESGVECMSRTSGQDNNFGSFLFTYSSQIGNDGIGGVTPGLVAQWNASQNNMYMFLAGVEQKWMTEAALADPDNHVPDFKKYAGCAVTAIKDGAPDTYDEQIPAEILAATDYTSVNCTQNYMFYQFSDRVATVTDDQTADRYDLNRFNYIGRTQTAGQLLEFYQRGTLGGGAQDAVDMNVYANEMWLKDYLSAQFMSAFLSLPTIPANDIGEAMLITMLQAGCDQAKFNGVFSVGKDLNTTQQLYITQITGDKMAWRQVATLGYWFSVQFLSRVTKDSRTEWYAKYILVYGKDDAIRAVEGQDVLI